MKRKFLTALMALVATLCLCFGLAACGGKDDEPQEGGDEQDVDIEELEYEKREDEQGGAYFAVIGIVTVEEHEIVIPASREGLPVKEIGESAFEASADARCAALTSIEIPDSVTEIAEHAFEGCNGLTNMVIPGNVATIGDSAFAYCSGLERVTIGRSVTSIGRNAFYGCGGLTGIQFQGGTEEWQAIEKGVHWDYETGDYTVTCTGGTV